MTDQVAAQAGIAEVSFDDTNFEPQQTGGGDHTRFFMISANKPERPFQDRKFQLGGIDICRAPACSCSS